MSNFFTKLASSVGIVTLVAASTSASLVSAASEFLAYADLLADNGVISTQSSEAGYRLSSNITRAELAKVVANLGGIDIVSCTGDVYSDVGAAQGDLCGYIEALADAGVVSTASATFRPTASVTRAEMVKMILGALGETGSEADAGYMDLSSMGDLAGYVNRANELGCAADADYFRPNATASRGEAFKIAACAAGLELPVDPVDPVPPSGTGVVSTGTVMGALTASLEGTAMAQYVPKNASSVKVGAVKLAAGANDVTVQSLVVSRSGLGNASDITSSNGVRASQNGVVVSSSADYYNSTSQKATVYFSPALVVKAGSSQVVDILVNLSGAENSQHQFTLDAVNASNTTVTGAPITLGLLNTTSYLTTTTTASVTNAGGTVTAGKTQQLFAKVDVSAGGRETKITGFTLTRANGALTGSTIYGSDLVKRLQNVKVYKNGVAVGTVTMTAEKLSVNGLADVLSAGNTQTYEIKADILVDASSNAIGLKFDASTDVNAIETTTGYATQVSAANTVQNILFGAVEFTFSKQSTGNVTVAPGTNNVKLFDGKLQSSTPVSVRTLTITPTITGTGITAFVNDQLSVKLNGSEIATLTAIANATGVPKTVSFVVDSANPAVLTIEGSIKNNTNVAPSSYQFMVALTEVRDSSNNTISSLGAGSNLTGDKTTVNTSEVELKTATYAAPSTSRIYSSAEQEIGRFALTARNEVARVQSIVVNNGGTATIQTIANSTSSARLMATTDNVTWSEISSTVTISSNTLTFSSMNDTIGKDVTKNYKVMLGVTSVDSNYGQTAILTVLTGGVTVVRDSNSTAITPSGSASLKTYTIGAVAPTVTLTSVDENTFKVRVTNPDSNTGITLTSTKFDFKTALPGNTTYAATACLRDLGNTNACGGSGTSTATGAVPALAQSLAVAGLATNMTADKNGGYVEFNVYVNSANLLPLGGQLQVALTQLNYTVGGSPDVETYVGTSGASATFTK